MTPPRPHGVDAETPCGGDDEVDVRIIVLVASSWNDDKFVCEPQVLDVRLDVIRRHHRHQVQHVVVERLEGPRA